MGQKHTHSSQVSSGQWRGAGEEIVGGGGGGGVVWGICDKVAQ